MTWCAAVRRADGHVDASSDSTSRRRVRRIRLSASPAAYCAFAKSCRCSREVRASPARIKSAPPRGRCDMSSAPCHQASADGSMLCRNIMHDNPLGGVETIGQSRRDAAGVGDMVVASTPSSSGENRPHSGAHGVRYAERVMMLKMACPCVTAFTRVLAGALDELAAVDSPNRPCRCRAAAGIDDAVADGDDVATSARRRWRAGTA